MTSTTQPIHLVATTLAHIYSHIHTILVLGLYCARFSSLVADPTRTLGTDALALMVLQGAYCVICLSLPGTTASTAATTSAVETKLKKGGREGKGVHAIRKRPREAGVGDVVKKLVPAFLSALVAIVLVPFLVALLVLHGAPLTPLPTFYQTLLLALHLSVLSLPPLLFTHTLSPATVREIFAAMLPFDEVWGGCIGLVVGAWLGAVPIPLDWDRPWQRWPVTVVVGSVIGWVVGRLVGGSVCWGKRVWFGGSDDIVEGKKRKDE